MPRDYTGRPSRRNRPTQPSFTCAVCGRTIKKQDNFLRHLRTEHGLEDAPAFDPDVPSDPQSGDEGDEAEQPAANHGPPVPPAVNHKLSGPPEGPYWDWNKGGDAYKARTALPDVAKMGLPGCVLGEYQAQMDFINTECKAILQKIDASTAKKPRELAAYEEAKLAWDECTR